MKRIAKNKCEIRPNYGVFGLSSHSLVFVIQPFYVVQLALSYQPTKFL